MTKTNFYGDGHSERVVGELLTGRRDRFVPATEFSVGFPSDFIAGVEADVFGAGRVA
ncbi:hypothetical protein [Amycolatopsis sp. 195334CR]|uniref:hypothetical protein n=1 Tax=Amycolatopsis sp. 195334CR TaxID=2814588 RepID=UPI001A8E27A4|nr:hypothetical protein [Amycolatopsis sp. 195334CR]MBN6033960.1 hypothetical protein [Amycolatopsis sp. 195334CR]